MELASLQRGLRDLIRGTGAPRGQGRDTAYLQDVAGSAQLRVTRAVVRWWQSFQVERYCVLTATLLRRQGRFDQVLDEFMRRQEATPFIERLGEQFLADVQDDPDRLVRSVASYEQALLARLRGREAPTVEWDRDPEAVLMALLEGSDLPPRSDQRYQTTVS